MAERALALAEENRLPQRSNVSRRLNRRDVDGLLGWRQRRHLRHSQGRQRKQPEYDGDEPRDPKEIRLDEEENQNTKSNNRQCDQLQLCNFTHNNLSLWNGTH